MSAPAPVVCFSGQPLDHPLPTNRQQIMRRVARTHPVVFVETGDFLGVHLANAARRRPGAAATLARHVRAERHGERLWVVRAPNVAPYGAKHRAANRLNMGATGLAVRAHLRALGLGPAVAWAYDPRAADALSAMGPSLVAYDCVDHYVEQAGTDPRRRELIEAVERRMLARSDVVFTTSESLYSAKSPLNPNTHLVRNVADVEHFGAAAEGLEAPADLPPTDRPRLGFIGNLMTSKVDVALLAEAAAARPGWEFVLVGPQPDPADLEPLRRLPNVLLMGPRPYEDAPRYLAQFDVALIPYWLNAYTDGCFPLKFFEYMASGRPVVASGLPELRPYAEMVELADDAPAFIAACERAIRDGRSGAAARRALAAENSWDSRAQRLMDLVDEALTG